MTLLPTSMAFYIFLITITLIAIILRSSFVAVTGSISFIATHLSSVVLGLLRALA